MGFRQTGEPLVVRTEVKDEIFKTAQDELFGIDRHDLLTEVGFNNDEADVLLKKLGGLSSPIKQEAFDARMQLHPLVLERRASSEIGGTLSVNNEARLMGEAIFWAYLAESDPGFCEAITSFEKLSKPEYRALEDKLEQFVATGIFANDAPCRAILQKAFNNEATTLQTDFLKGLLDPFLKCGDDEAHKGMLEKLVDWFQRLRMPKREGFLALHLTADQEAFLTNIPEDGNYESVRERDAAQRLDARKQISLLLDTLSDDPKTLVASLSTELQLGVSLDEVTFKRIVDVCSEKIDWGRTSDETIMALAHREMKIRGIGSWSQGESFQAFQMGVLLDALFSVDEVDGAGFSGRNAASVEKSLRVSLSHSTFKPDYLEDLRRYVSVLLVEKDKLAGKLN